MKSMTGYAKKSFFIKNYGNITIEMKTLNGKNLNINVKLPYELSKLEIGLRKNISGTVKRGNVYFGIKTDYTTSFISGTIKEIMKRIKALNLRTDNNLQNLIVTKYMDMLMPEMIIGKKTEKQILLNSNMIIKNLDKMRITEGREISVEINKYLKIIEQQRLIIIKNSKKCVKRKEQKLRTLIKKNESLILESILVYADKMDISEELSRLKSHIGKLRSIKSGSSMNFVLQEMLRESNTIGSKSEDIKIISSVITIKENIEKLKEQVLNVE
ncbi:DUF1732 domain-containing protein [candidate division WOR-3 bacterium]|nr:DUF1732 domain-containing protein [candidate division WOR-3 bacterium]